METGDEPLQSVSVETTNIGASVSLLDTATGYYLYLVNVNFTVGSGSVTLGLTDNLLILYNKVLTSYFCNVMSYPLSPKLPTKAFSIVPDDIYNYHTGIFGFQGLNQRPIFVSIYPANQFICSHRFLTYQDYSISCKVSFSTDPTIPDSFPINFRYPSGFFLNYNPQPFILKESVNVTASFSLILPSLASSIHQNYYFMSDVTVNGSSQNILDLTALDYTSTRIPYTVRKVLGNPYSNYRTLYIFQRGFSTGTSSFYLFKVLNGTINNVVTVSDTVFAAPIPPGSIQLPISYTKSNDVVELEFTGYTLYQSYYNCSMGFLDPSWINLAITSGNFYQSTRKLSFFALYQSSGTSISQPVLINIQGLQSDIEAPVIQSFTIDDLGGMLMVITVEATDDISGVYKISMGSLSMYSWDVMNGTIVNGKWSKVFDYSKLTDYYRVPTLSIWDVAGNMKELEIANYGVIFTDTPVYPNVIPRQFGLGQTFNNLSISTLKFEKNDIDLSQLSDSNSVYINFTNVNRWMTIRLIIDPISEPYLFETKDHYYDVFYGTWDETRNMFKIDFTLPLRMFTGPVNFIVYYPDVVFYSQDLLFYGINETLRVVSDNADQMPPIITKLMKFQDTDSNVIGWDMLISDTVNGFKEGFISVISSIDSTGYNFTITPKVNQNIFEDTYSIRIQLPNYYQSQVFSLNLVRLVDQHGVTSQVEYGQSNPYTDKTRGISPLYRVVNSVNQTITVSAKELLDTQTPSLLQVSFSRETVDVGRGDRSLSVYFNISAPIANVSRLHIPTCSLMAINFREQSTKAVLVDYQYSSASYECNFELDYGFGYPHTKIILSLYGYSDTYGNLGGVSTHDIIMADLPYYVSVEFTRTVPIILSVPDISDQGGQLSIFGNYFYNVSFENVYVNNNTIHSQPIQLGENNLIICRINPIANDFDLQVRQVEGNSNVYRVKVIKTIPPADCPGTPKCGGLSNGQCTPQGCVCVQPWNGLDCQSRTIYTNTPVINTTTPSSGNQFNTTLPNGETVELRTLISILSLDEMSMSGQLVQSHDFPHWIFTNITGNGEIPTYLYRSNVTSRGIITTVSVTVQYFPLLTNITFANIQLQMQPSTVKYRVDITPFGFEKSVNYLRLVMSATLFSSSTSNSTCSAMESGDQNEDNEYVKLQIDTHSLYGRFIKRAIIDNRIQSISNTIMKSNKTSNTESQSIIGINIPFYRVKSSIDPDFSVLIDTSPANTKPNSKCSSLSSSEDQSNVHDNKLTSSQIAGIIIGAIGFTSVLVISTIYYFYKKRQAASALRKINMKINKLQK
ncbi:hypothetical protein DLAC_08463 [Tieghemostelium lacteum]|uniref:EGF-like domain-containing protein n=1 Tax=Tieghemostelium lacteum TaxID=361077 RepID=A0A151Z7G1_TIELA|nr:hypothetical protein DLAC_08463 [Tieghemostelium lacteum]|eukprot:KYQ89900.1 hypothetical protein DLAC_08463 [Tieghemostelium lacteum]